MIQKTMERLVDTKILSMKQYFENADPKDVKAKAQEYDRTKEAEKSGGKKDLVKERSIEDSYIPPIL